MEPRRYVPRPITGPALMAATGLTQRYCWQVRAGRKLHHPMHWDAVLNPSSGGRLAESACQLPGQNIFVPVPNAFQASYPTLAGTSQPVNLLVVAALVVDVATKEDVTDRHDWVALYRSTGLRLWRAIYAYSGGQRDVADDAVAEAFARAMQYDADIRRPESWLYRTAFRVAAAELRRVSTSEDAVVTRDHEEIDAGVADLTAALRALSPNQRAAIWLFYFADLPTREVARVMGTSVAAVKVHLHRGRQRLRGLLGEEDGDD
jgi:RNA polymerase sigma factor (sigma-70 family)